MPQRITRYTSVCDLIVENEDRYLMETDKVNNYIAYD